MRITDSDNQTIFEVLYVTYKHADFNGLYGVRYHFNMGPNSSVRHGNFVYMESQMNLAISGHKNYRVHGRLPDPIPEGKL